MLYFSDSLVILISLLWLMEDIDGIMSQRVLWVDRTLTEVSKLDIHLVYMQVPLSSKVSIKRVGSM